MGPYVFIQSWVYAIHWKLYWETYIIDLPDTYYSGHQG